MAKLQLPAQYAISLRIIQSGSASLATTPQPTQMQGCQKRRRNRDIQKVMVANSSAMRTINSSLTHCDRVIAVNNGNTATLPGSKPFTTTNTTSFLDTDDCYRLYLRNDHRATTRPILLDDVRRSLENKRITLIQTMPRGL